MESELFGHTRGAFTGAVRDHRGLCEAASGGTLFLDEVGELPLALQAKMLRFLEDYVVEPLGGSGRIRVDVRVVAASNRELAVAVEGNEFREDLYYRLNVFDFHLPPLRDRHEDAVALAEFFLAREAEKAGRTFLGFSGEAVAALLRAPWPGNVRELLNRVRRAVITADGPEITAADLKLESCAAGPQTIAGARTRAEIACVQRALRWAEGNRSEAARILGISRTQLYELMRRHALA
jgi:two-component system NtrC family response regulator